VNNSKHTIYIVDDDVSVCSAISLLLKSHGFKVETFIRAEDFLAFKHLKLPSCLVLDIQMPDINGLALQDAMATRKLAIPIIFITGHGDIPMSVRAMKAGAIDFLPKPFTKKNCLMPLRKPSQKTKFK
jgi:FixJ family two-component response regulator